MNDMISVSASGNRFVDYILPVVLDPPMLEEYEGYLYPNYVSPKSREKFDISRRVTDGPVQYELIELLIAMNEIMSEINVGLGVLKGIAVNNDEYVSRYNDSEEFLKYHSSNVNNYTSILAKDSLEKQQGIFLQMLRGNNHIIKPSQKYQGGYDIIWTGKPCSPLASPLLGRQAPSKPLNPLSCVADFALDKGIAPEAIKKAQSLVSILTNSSISMENCHKRQFFQLPLSFDFTQFNHWKFDRNESQVASIPLFPHTLVKSNISADLQRRLGKYYSIVVAYTPSSTVVDAAVRAMKAGQAVNNSDNITREALALEPNISMSLALNLPKQFVSYITQTPLNEHPALSSLNMWVSMWKRYAFKVAGTKKKGDKDDSVSRHRFVPRYVLKASSLSSLVEKRKEFGMSLEEGCTDHNSVFVANNGSLNYMIGTTQGSGGAAKEYEDTMDKVIQACAELNMPVDFSTNVVNDCYMVEAGGVAPIEKMQELRKEISHSSGKMLGFSWDFNTALYVNPSNPSKIESCDLSGACKPDELAIADYLSKPFAECMRLMMPSCPAITGVARAAEWGAGSNQPDLMLSQVTMFDHLFNIYELLVNQKQAANFQELVKKAASFFKIKSLTDNEDIKTYEEGIYHTVLSSDLKDLLGNSVPECLKIKSVLSSALKEAAAIPNTKHYAKLVQDNPTNVDALKPDSPRYFFASPTNTIAKDKTLIENPLVCSADKFANVYKYLGGYIFYLMLLEVKRHLSKFLYKVDFEDDQIPVALGEDQKKVLPSYITVSRAIAPFIQMCTAYIPNSDEIYEKASVLETKNKREDSIDINNIQVPGSIPSAEMFPHQVKGHQSLRNRPRFAAIDVSPGGGKTIMLLADAMCCIKECMEEKPSVVIKPLIIVPTGLIKNWVEDLVKVAGKNWNVIPINTQIMARWGMEALRKLIADAPRNTIVVCGMSVLTQAGKYTVAYGDHVERCSNALDLVKSLNFNYVAVDEAHKIKNETSTVHKMVKLLCTSSWVEYVRLASGTLISNEVKDIVGEASLFSSQIFRTVDEYMFEQSLLLGDKKLNVSMGDSKRSYQQITRDKLAQHVSLITIKRKEWAFMLPIPIETFEHPDLDYGSLPYVDLQGNRTDTLKSLIASGKVTEEYVYLTGMHRAAYEALVKEMGDALRKELEKRKNNRKNQDEDGNGDDEEDDEDVVEDIEESSSVDVTDKELDKLMAGPLGKYWLQRADQFLIDPLGDIEFSKLTIDSPKIQAMEPKARQNWEKIIEAFDRMRETNFRPRKLSMVFDLIRRHYELKPWTPDGEYVELESDVDYKGKHYIARKRDLETTSYKPVISKLPPDQAPEIWKPENRGKVLIFCRYNRSVEAILQYMPEDLKKKTVTFYGWMDPNEKVNNIERFKKDPNIQILLANEEGIKEGHNLQVASRMIRVELPWTPGDLEQAQSRIFRPDPKGYADGEMDRSVIYIDIISSDRTLEMNKLGRLYSKVISNCKYEEGDNPAYSVIQEVDDSKLKLRLGKDDVKQFISFNETLAPPVTRDPNASEADVLKTHMGAWRKYVTIRNTEFMKMKREAMQNGTDRLIPLPVTPPMAGFNKMERVPYVANQEIDLLAHDDLKLGLVKFTDYITNPRNAKYLKAAQKGPKDLKDLMEGTPVHTDFGYGVIVGFTPKRTVTKGKGKAKTETDEVDVETMAYQLKVGQVLIKMAGSDEVVKVPSSIVYIGTSVSKAHMKMFTTKKTDFEIPKMVKEKVETTPMEETPEQPADENDDEITSILNSMMKRIRVRNKAEGEPAPSKNKIKSIIPVVYNGFLSVEARLGSERKSKEDRADLEEYDFLVVPQYAYIKIVNKENFERTLKFIITRCGYDIEEVSLERLALIKKCFDEHNKFNVTLQPFSNLPRFQVWNHKPMRSQKHIKIHAFAMFKAGVAERLKEAGHPITGAEILHLAIDLDSNPSFEKYIDHTIPKSAPTTTITHVGSREIRFVRSKQEAMKVMGSLVGSNKFGLTEKDFKAFADTLRKLHVRSGG